MFESTNQSCFIATENLDSLNQNAAAGLPISPISSPKSHRFFAQHFTGLV